MLSEIERDMLTNRNKLSVKERRDNEFKIRRKLKKWINDSNDAAFVLNTLPYKQLIKFLSNKNIVALMDTVMRVIYALGPTHILKGEYAPSGNFIPVYQLPEMKEKPLTRPSIRRGYAEVVRKATPEEIERAQIIKDFIMSLSDCLGDDDIRAVIEDLNEVVES